MTSYLVLARRASSFKNIQFPLWKKGIKRTKDVIVSFVLLILLSPIYILVAMAIKSTSKGSIIFAQKRVGYRGKLFTIYKFRSMVEHAEMSSGPVLAQRQDPRITPVGRWLRRLRLDEIPQLYNVLKGDMSLVGPRPERPFFVEQFKSTIPYYTRRLTVRPGITGWAQVMWKYDECFEDVVTKTKYDLFYIENLSIQFDVKILLLTITTVFSLKGQ
jgi:exopolysaccharide biosynthesis polyprenyl glycosylphosphotransferase